MYVEPVSDINALKPISTQSEWREAIATVTSNFDHWDDSSRQAVFKSWEELKTKAVVRLDRDNQFIGKHKDMLIV